MTFCLLGTALTSPLVPRIVLDEPIEAMRILAGLHRSIEARAMATESATFLRNS